MSPSAPSKRSEELRATTRTLLSAPVALCLLSAASGEQKAEEPAPRADEAPAAKAPERLEARMLTVEDVTPLRNLRPLHGMNSPKIQRLRMVEIHPKQIEGLRAVVPGGEIIQKVTAS